MNVYLSAQDVKRLVQFFGQQVRYYLNDKRMTDEWLIACGLKKNAHQQPIRIEIRPTGKSDLANAQVVVRAFEPARRDHVIKKLKSHLWVKKSQIVIKSSGTMSIECNRAGVDKALPLIFLSYEWLKVMDIINYTPAKIDARVNPVLIACDGDNTLYGRPTLDRLPLLKDSAALKPLKELLRLGCVFILISGNDMRRTEMRIKGVFGALANRVLICANGGADLMYYDKKGKLQLIPGYQQKALLLREKSLRGKTKLIAYYIGDDASINGNDGPAFKWVKASGRFYVGNDTPDKIFKIPANQCYPGHMRATAYWLNNIYKRLI